MKALVLQGGLLLALGITLLVFPQYGVDSGNVLYGCALSVSGICLWCLLSWKLSGGIMFEPYAMFLIAAICFNAGHIVLFACGLDAPSSVMARFSSDTSLKTMTLITVGICSFHFGGLWAKLRRPDAVQGQPHPDLMGFRLSAVATVGLVMLAISLPAWLFVIYTRIGRVMQYGYFVASFGGTTNTGLAHLPELLAEALAPSLVFLVAGSKSRPAMRRLALVAMLLFGATTLFTGSKGPAVMGLLAFGWAWHRHVRLKGWIVAVGACLLAVVVIPLTTAIREVAGRDRASMTAIADAYLGIDNPVVAFLLETGWTATTVAHTIELVPTVRGYDYGQSYVYAGLAVLPNVAGGFHPAKEHGFLADWLVSSLAPEYAARGGGWGFSFIAEAYANFGLYGAPVALAVIGFFLSSFFGWAQSSVDPAKTAMIGASLCNCLLYARGESAVLLRDIVWYALIPYLLVSLLTRHQTARSASYRQGVDLIPSALRSQV